MPRGVIRRIQWSQRQREIYHLVQALGKTREEVYAAGYGKDSINDVMRAIFRKEMPPRYDPEEASMVALSARNNGHKPITHEEPEPDDDNETGEDTGGPDGRDHFEGDPPDTWRDKRGYLHDTATSVLMKDPLKIRPEKSVKGNGHKPDPKESAISPTSTKVRDSVTTVIRGREAVIYSNYLVQAKEAAIDRFGFPPDKSDSEFIDWWLLESFAKYELYLNRYFAGPNAPPVCKQEVSS